MTVKREGPCSSSVFFPFGFPFMHDILTSGIEVSFPERRLFLLARSMPLWLIASEPTVQYHIPCPFAGFCFHQCAGSLAVNKLDSFDKR